MSREKGFVTYERGYNGEYIVLINGMFYSTCDSWKECREEMREALNQNLLAIC
jgi:hypothetical protein